jgi:hypothetical protein
MPSDHAYLQGNGTMTERNACKLDVVSHAKFLDRVRAMCIYGLDADLEPLGDLSVRRADRKLQRDFELSR